MLKLDNNLLEELGLGSLPEAQKRQMLQHIYDTLELRVGTHLANQMTDKQLEEFEKFIDAGGDTDQSQALRWLETNLPNYKQVVQDTFEALRAEVKQMAPQLLAAAAQQPQEAQVVSQPQPGYAPSSQAAPTAPAAPQQTAPTPPIPPAPNQPWQPPVTQPMDTPAPSFGQPQTAPSQASTPTPDYSVQSTPQPFQPAPQFGQPQNQSVPTPPPASWQTGAGSPAPSQPPVPQPWQPPQPPADQQPPQAA